MFFSHSSLLYKTLKNFKKIVSIAMVAFSVSKIVFFLFAISKITGVVYGETDENQCQNNGDKVDTIFVFEINTKLFFPVQW